MKNFNEWITDKHSEFLIVDWLEANNYEVTEENIRLLIERGFLNKIAQYGRKAVLPLALAAGMGMGGSSASAASPPTMNRYNVSSAPIIYGDKTAQANYGKFDMGPQGEIAVKSLTQVEMNHIQETINGELAKSEMKECFVEIIQTKSVKEGTFLVIDISSRDVKAYNEFSAKTKFVKIMKNVLQKGGFEIKGLRILSGDNANMASHLNATQVESIGDKVLFRVEVTIARRKW
jgi:hypothetical protein